MLLGEFGEDIRDLTILRDDDVLDFRPRNRRGDAPLALGSNFELAEKQSNDRQKIKPEKL